MTNDQPLEPHAKSLASVPGRKRWPTIVLMLVVFVAGIAIGGGAMFMYSQYRTSYNRAHPELAPIRMADRISDDLKLNAEQSEKVRKIVTFRWENFQDIRRHTYWLYQPELDRLEKQVDDLLTGEQKTKWENYMDNMRKRFNPIKAATTTAASQPAMPKTAK